MVEFCPEALQRFYPLSISNDSKPLLFLAVMLPFNSTIQQLYNSLLNQWFDGFYFFDRQSSQPLNQ